MKKYIIAAGVFHPTMTAQQISNAISTKQTLSSFATYNEIIDLLKKRGDKFIETDKFPDIDHGTFFSFDDTTGRYYTTFVLDGHNPDGEKFEDLYRKYKDSL